MGQLYYSVLVIGNNSHDIELIENHLNKLDFNIHLDVVNKKKDFKNHLQENIPHLIISGYQPSDFTTIEALDIIRQLNIDLPFILVPAFIEEEKAIDAMRRGATDYVFMNNLNRLAPVVTRELTRFQNQQKKEEALNQTLRKYENLVHSIDGIVWESDAKTFEFLYVGPQAKEILGYTPSEWCESKTFWQDHIHPDDRKFAVKYCHTKTVAGENHMFEYRMIDANAKYVWLRDYVTVVLENGQPSKLRGIMVDITHQKETEFRLDKTIKKLKKRIKEQKCLQKISSLDQQTLSIPEILAEAVQLISDGFQYPEITEASIEYEGEIYQTKNFNENDEILTIKSDASGIGKLIINVIYTEKKSREDTGPFLKEEQNLLTSIAKNLALKVNRIIGQTQLIEKRDQLEKAYNLARIGNWEVDTTTLQMTWSDKTKEIHEVPEDFEPTLEKLTELYTKSDDWPSIQKSIEELLNEQKSIDHEVKIVTANGNERWIRVLGQSEFKDGECIRMYGSMQDIDYRKRVEEQRQKSEKRLKALVQEGLDLIAVVDDRGNYKYIAPTKYRFEEMGMEPKDYIGKSAFAMFHKEDMKPFITKLKKLKSNESINIGPLRYRRKNNEEWRWMESTVTNLTENPAIKGYVTNSRDVTEQIKQERKLRDIVENSTNLFYRYDVHEDNSFNFTYVSPQSEKLLGCKPDEAKTRWKDFITEHPASKEGYRKSLRAIEKGKPQESHEIQLQKIDGKKIWVEVNEAPIVENGKTVSMVGSLTEITEQKRYEEKLEELSLVAAKTTDIIIITDAEDRITWVNKSFEKLLGFSLEESLGKTPGKLLRREETDPKTFSKIQRLKKDRKRVQEAILNYSKDERKIWVDITADPIFDDDGNFKGYIGIDKDVTEQVKQRKKLQESVERYDIVAKATSDTIWDADLEKDIVTFNSNIQDVFGYEKTKVEKSGDWWFAKIHPDDREHVTNVFKTAERNHKDRVKSVYRFLCADGTYKYINNRSYIINDESGKPIRIIGAMQDITKQKEENLWLKLLESAIANSTEAIAIIEEKSSNRSGRNILYVNEAFEKMTGFSKKEAVGSSLFKFLGSKSDERAIIKVMKALDRGENCQIEISFTAKKNRDKWAHVSFAPVKNKNGEFSHWVCIGRDITERRMRISQLRESLQEKETLLMEIHHRVKNNLAVVSSMMQLQAMEEQSESLQKKLYDSVARIRTMVTIHEMLYESGSFSKLDFSINLKKLVSMIMETIHNQKKIDVEFHCDNVELNVNQAIPTSLIVNEVVTNSIKHGFENKKGGKITIELKELENNILLKVIDDGIGLPDNFNQLDGSSLGLQLIEVLSKQMDASYSYDSEMEQGTEFSIQFEKTLIKGIGNAYLTQE